MPLYFVVISAEDSKDCRLLSTIWGGGGGGGGRGWGGGGEGEKKNKKGRGRGDGFKHLFTARNFAGGSPRKSVGGKKKNTNERNYVLVAKRIGNGEVIEREREIALFKVVRFNAG